MSRRVSAGVVREKKNAAGKRTTYSLKLVTEICAWIADGKSLRSYCVQKDNPCISAVQEWLIIHKDFAEHYARARDDQGDSLFDEITDIADEKPDGSMDVQAFNSRQRLRIDARKWAASKLKPKKYGDRIDLNHGGQSGNPVQVLTHAEAKRALENLLKLKDEVVS